MFDLENAIATWRHHYIQSRTFSEEDLIELERHLRDHLHHLMEQGVPEEEAFRKAVQGLGDFYEAEEEYRKVYWTKLKRNHARMRELTWSLAMLQNYIKIVLRNLYKHKGYAFINIVGLGIGLACCFLIVLYIQHELSFDRFHERSDRIYRLIRVEADDATDRTAVTASAFAPHLQEMFPDIENTVRVQTNISGTLRNGSETRKVSGFAYMDGSGLEVFSFPLLSGNAQTALQAPATMVLTERAAISFFGETDPIGQSLTMLAGDQKIDLRITGILADVPSNSHLQFDYLVSFNTLLEVRGADALEEYTNMNYLTYLLLPPGMETTRITDQSAEFLGKYQGEYAATNTRLMLQPLTDIHLTTDIAFDVATNSDKIYIFIFGGVALLILLIASINFMNLSTARATLRAKEVGVRKVIGAHRTQLIRQFFGESVVASILSIIVALILLVACSPFVGPLLGDQLVIPPSDWRLVVLLVGIGLTTGLLAGFYPAFVLSSFQPSRVLKGEVTRGKHGALLRKTLIIFQFSISVFLIIAMMTVYQQLDFMKTKDLGFNKEQVVYIDLSSGIKARFNTFRQALLQSPHIQHVALAGNVPGRVNTQRGYKWPGDEQEDGQGFYTMFGDGHTIETLGLELIQGRSFSDDLATDTTHAYILNESAARLIGWDNPIDQSFRVWDAEMGQVIGVVKDFHFKSLHQEIEPVVLDMKPDWSWSAAMRIAPAAVSGALDHVRTQWAVMEPEFPLIYRFLDTDFDRLYRAEERLGTLFSYFTVLAILVACLGLFGLVAFVAEQRRKEISIRKVMGASIGSLLFLVAQDFGKLVLWSALIATPVAYWVMDGWLEGFAYQISQSVWTFLGVGASVLVIALLTVSYQSIKTALADPAEVLRYE